MNLQRLLFAIMSVGLMLVPSAFARHPGAQAGFQQAFEQAGSEVTPGGVSATAGRHPASSLAIASVSTPDVFTENLIGYLEKSGFQVSEGKPMVYSLTPSETCKDYTYPALNSCLGSNPAAPYVIAMVKSWPDEFVDPVTINAFGPVPEPGYSPTYRLDPREAIVIYGAMPPPGRYMGL